MILHSPIILLIMLLHSPIISLIMLLHTPIILLETHDVQNGKLVSNQNLLSLQCEICSIGNTVLVFSTICDSVVYTRCMRIDKSLKKTTVPILRPNKAQCSIL
uniref:Uncharacterized protein n=1 Tax=Cacopsylla melanoneura TaxID=428564 RepID=A0A8D8LBK6_9HEMI